MRISYELFKYYSFKKISKYAKYKKMVIFLYFAYSLVFWSNNILREEFEQLSRSNYQKSIYSFYSFKNENMFMKEVETDVKNKNNKE